jgi:hypothetical protein
MEEGEAGVRGRSDSEEEGRIRRDQGAGNRERERMDREKRNCGWKGRRVLEERDGAGGGGDA